MEFYGRTIKRLHVELSSQCNLECPQCPRTNQGKDSRHFEERSLSLEEFNTVVTPYMVQEMEHIYFCGNLGDPLMAKDLIAILDYIRDHNKNCLIDVHTNASLRNETWWSEFPKHLGRHHKVVFSVDGLEDTNHLYRQKSVWGKIMDNARAFIAAGGTAHWHYLIFEHNKHQVDAARALSLEMGFEFFQPKQTLRRMVKTIKWLKPGDLKRYEEENTAQSDAAVVCQAVRENSIYLSAEGKFYPCCYTGGTEAVYPRDQLDFDYNNTRRVNRLPHNPVAGICKDKCRTINGRNVTERQFLTEENNERANESL